MTATHEHAPAASTARRDIAIALALAFVFRLWYLLLLNRAIDTADAIHYINMAQTFAEGDLLGFDANLPVLYSILGAIAHLFIFDWEQAFWAVSLIASTLLIVPVYFIARQLHGTTTANITALLVAVWPWLIDYASRVSTEALAVTLWFTAIWFLYRAIENGRAALILAPLTLFALHLARPEGTFIMLASPLAAANLAWKKGPDFTRRAVIHTIACIALLAVYALFMKFAIGTATVSYRAPMAGDLPDYFRRGVIEGARTFLQLNFNVLPLMMGPLLLVFFGIGFFRPADAHRKYRLEAVILLFCAVQWSLTLANFSPSPRYVMAVIVALSLWSAQGILILSQRAAGLPYGQFLKTIPVALTLAIMLLGTAAEITADRLSDFPRTPVEYRTAGKWMKGNLEPGLVISRKPQIGFYADMPTVGPPLDATPETLIDFAIETRARYVVLDERHTATMAPGLRPLFDDAPDAYVLQRDDLSPYPGARVIIYELNHPELNPLTEDEFPDPSSHMGPDAQRRTK